MPIQPNYTWRESSSTVELTGPLKGASPKIVDIILCSNHLKLSFPPYLLDLPLAENIDADSAESKALVKAGTLHITLVKLEEGKTWGNLLWEGTKEEINQRRMAAFAEREGRIQRQHEQAVSKRIENERMTLKMQMVLEEDERQLIDDKKAAEKKAAEEALYKTLADLPAAAGPAADKRTEQQLIPDDDDDNGDISVCNKSTTTGTTDTTTSCPPSLPNRQVSSIPPPRATIRATFKHTPRPFQTPARESTITTEREFLLKNKPSLLNGCGDTKSSDVGDVDASWIAKKGEEFFAKGDYRSAVSAFSTSLKRDSTMIEAMVHRAASHLQLGDVEDCLTDLASAKAGMKASLGGIDDDSSLCTKIEQLEAIVQAQQQKEKADELLRKNDLSGALLLYDKAVSMAPACIPTLANRSACNLAMENYEATVSDCTSVLDMLERSNLDEPSLEKPSSLTPRLTREIRKKLKDAVSRRRVLALEHLGKSDDSKGDGAKEMAGAEADASVEKAVAELDSVD